LDAFNVRISPIFNRPSAGGYSYSRGFTEKWGWVITLDALAGSDVNRWDQVTGWPVGKFINAISFFQDKQEEEKRIQDQINAKYRK
jgi:hypothetical protein